MLLCLQDNNNLVMYYNTFILVVLFSLIYFKSYYHYMQSFFILLYQVKSLLVIFHFLQITLDQLFDLNIIKEMMVQNVILKIYIGSNYIYCKQKYNDHRKFNQSIYQLITIIELNHVLNSQRKSMRSNNTAIFNQQVANNALFLIIKLRVTILD